jgi:hypothetical protein
MERQMFDKMMRMVCPRVYMTVATTLAILALSLAAPSAAHAQQVTTCSNASPYDYVPDDAELQNCVDNYDWVLLEPNNGPGYVGYLLADTLRLRRSGLLLTTSSNPRKVTIKAANNLSAPMVRAYDSNDYEISFIIFDGNGPNRDVSQGSCNGNYFNVELTGSGYHVRYVESASAVCGTGMVTSGSGYEVVNSLFYDNGRQPEDGAPSGMWADGLTVYSCVNSTIRDNYFADNTDVDLGVNGSSGCSAYRNTVVHNAKYAFAGLVFGDPGYSGGEFSDNSVSSSYNKLGFGLIVGCHPWLGVCPGDAHNVYVHNNSSTGAVVNLAVDGLDGGTVINNSYSGAQGDRVLNCTLSADFTAGHFTNSTIQGGYTPRVYDPPSCQ